MKSHLLKIDGSKNYYIDTTNMKFNCRKNEHVADIKYYRKIIPLARLYKEKPSRLTSMKAI